MLKLIDIKKDYVTGDSVVHALKGVSLEFRKNEFVSILGQSGCGKTTLLNIIGGLDQYTSGDLVINGKSTKEYGDREWDTYRNHSVGFVFQSYNLIPHQTVLANVELALTLSGVSKEERKKRAIEALETVGLGEQIKKRPNQLSGGQMQRVAIARALVNNPDILLADEPTGALDSETSVQIMELLKAISKDKLIVMVTHNPDLAKDYSTRIINLLDGNVVSDSDPYTSTEAEAAATLPISAKAYLRGRKRELAFKKNEFKAVLSGMKGSEPTAIANQKAQAKSFIEEFNSTTASVYARMRADELEKARIAKEERARIMAEINALPEEEKQVKLAELRLKKAEEKKALKEKRLAEKKTSMSFLTALSLSLNNLMTKKGRTFLTAFAGSIGIIGIALVLSVSSGVNAYITSIEEGTMSSYPLEIKKSSMDVMTLLSTLMGSGGIENPEPGKVYSHDVLANAFVSANKGLTENNLVAFKAFLDNSEVIQNNVTDIKYSYSANLNTYVPSGTATYKATLDGIGGILSAISTGSSSMGSIGSMASSLMGGDVFKELIGDSEYIESQYDKLYGRYPVKANEVVLIVDNNQQISDMVLYSLGLKDLDELKQYVAQIYADLDPTPPKTQVFTYEELCAYTFKVLPDAEKYKVVDGKIVARTSQEIDAYLNSAMTLEIVGILTPSENASASSVMGAIAYTPELMKVIMESSNASAVVAAQQKETEKDLLTGLPFVPKLPVTTTIRSDLQASLINYGIDLSSEKYKEDTALISLLKDYLSREATFASILRFRGNGTIGAPWGGYTVDDYDSIIEIINTIEDTATLMMTRAVIMASTADGGAENFITLVNALLYEDLTQDPAEKHASTMNSIGFVDYSNPQSIKIYPKDFNAKQVIKDEIDNYNNTRSTDADKISYSDTVAMLMSSITTIVDAITYVLVAFVAISLIVSSIMIGIITYISVLERTKEIGILRAIGASKKDISRVFNAETLIVGFAAGLIGILVSLFFIVIINVILLSLTGLTTLQAVLPVGAAVVLVLISMGLTLIAGLFPAKVAATKDPVIALRSE